MSTVRYRANGYQKARCKTKRMHLNDRRCHCVFISRHKVGDFEMQYRQGNKRVIGVIKRDNDNDIKVSTVVVDSAVVNGTVYTVGVTLKLPQATSATKLVSQWEHSRTK